MVMWSFDEEWRVIGVDVQGRFDLAMCFRRMRCTATWDFFAVPP
jgi:hypothetical protein